MTCSSFASEGISRGAVIHPLSKAPTGFSWIVCPSITSSQTFQSILNQFHSMCNLVWHLDLMTQNAEIYPASRSANMCISTLPKHLPYGCSKIVAFLCSLEDPAGLRPGEIQKKKTSYLCSMILAPEAVWLVHKPFVRKT